MALEDDGNERRTSRPKDCLFNNLISEIADLRANLARAEALRDGYAQIIWHFHNNIPKTADFPFPVSLLPFYFSAIDRTKPPE